MGKDDAARLEHSQELGRARGRKSGKELVGSLVDLELCYCSIVYLCWGNLNPKEKLAGQRRRQLGTQKYNFQLELP